MGHTHLSPLCFPSLQLPVVRVFQCSHAHPTQTFQHRSVEVTQLLYLHFLGGNTSWITVHPTVPCSFCTSLTPTGPCYGPNRIFYMSFLLPGYSPDRSVPYCAPQHSPTDSEVGMGHLQLLLVVQQLLKSQHVSTASFLPPVISGRETLKTEGLLEIPSSSQANPAP